MKKNKIMRFASLVLVLTLLSTCAISGTFAKYTSTSVAGDSARVAKWEFDLNGTDITKSETFTFDLFNTVQDSTGDGQETDVDVDGTGSETVIAPGTRGSFKLSLKNESEVNATYSIAYDATNQYNIPIEFSLDQTNWYVGVANMNVNSKAINMNASEDITVYWRWAYEGTSSVNFTSTQTDVTDTALGNAGGAPSVAVGATITVTQVN